MLDRSLIFVSFDRHLHKPKDRGRPEVIFVCLLSRVAPVHLAVSRYVMVVRSCGLVFPVCDM